MKPGWLVLAVLLAACVSDGRSLKRGEADARAVRAEMGEPAQVLKAAHGGEVWFYPRGIAARETFRVELDSGGRLVGIEQVLDDRRFDRIVGGRTTRAEVLDLIGPPQFALADGTIWEYHYRWAQEPWCISVSFDQAGVVSGVHRRSETFV
jgi:hypothetical protein